MDATGAGDRFQTALELFEFGVSMQRQRFRRQRPTADDAEIDELLNAWMLHRPGAVQGDCAGSVSIRRL